MLTFYYHCNLASVLDTPLKLLSFTSKFLLAVDHSDFAALQDFSMAFNTVDHIILTERLQASFGIDGSALKWFQSYLLDHTQYDHHGTSCSSVIHLLLRRAQCCSQFYSSCTPPTWWHWLWNLTCHLTSTLTKPKYIEPVCQLMLTQSCQTSASVSALLLTGCIPIVSNSQWQVRSSIVNDQSPPTSSTHSRSNQQFFFHRGFFVGPRPGL